MNILLLEDNTTDADLCRRFLITSIPHCKVEIAETLKKAMEILAKSDFDIAVLDMKLPDGSGMDMLMNIRQSGKNIPVIILTGSGNEEIATAALKAGADDYLVKKNNYFSKLPVAIDYAIKNHRQNLKLRSEIINVLYIEHHNSDIDFTKRHIKQYAPQIHITAIHTADEALKILPLNNTAKSDYQVILLDFRLPGINALEFTKITRQERKLDIPVILVTGQGNEEVAIQAMKLGVNEYMVKNENYIVRLPALISNVYEHQQLIRKQFALSESESKYRLLAENSADVIFTLDLNLNYTFISPSVFKLRGFKPEEVINKNIKACLTPESYEKAKELFSEKLAIINYSKSDYDNSSVVELELLKKDKTTVWAEIKASIIFDENKNPISILGVTRDISHKKKYEEELSKSREEYKDFFDNDLTGDFLASTDGILLNCNQAFIEILGISSKEAALQMNLLDIYRNPEEKFSVIKELKKHGRLVNHEFQMQRADGKILDVIANIIGVFNNKNKLISFRGYIFDNTERKKAVDELKKLVEAVEQSPVSIIITDKKGSIEYVNEFTTKVTSYNSSELINKNPRIFSSGKTSVEKYNLMWNTINSGKTWHGEFLNKKKNAELYWEKVTISPILNSKGLITNFVAVKEDISEFKKTEQIKNVIYTISNAVVTTDNLEQLISLIQSELNTLIDASNFYLAFYDENTGLLKAPYTSDIIDRNREWPAEKSITGIVIKQKKGLLFTSDDFIEMYKRGEAVLLGKHAACWMGVPLIVDNKIIGAFVVQSYTNEKAYNQNDLKIFEFISEQISIAIHRKKTEEDLNFALAKAQESDQLKTAFLNNISHEIRTPFNGLLGFLSILKEDELNREEKEKYFNIIFKSADRLLSTISDIVDISQIETGQVKVKIVNTGINGLMNDLYQHFKEDADSKGLDLVLNTAGIEMNYYINTDINKLKSILNNLINNAIKFTKMGFVEFGFNYHETEKIMQFYVKDTGLGIPENKFQKIFERFIQADVTDTRQFEGSGLGLSISKSYTEMLGGKIWLESEEGKGSTFFFTIKV